jgi:hypothetical protein
MAEATFYLFDGFNLLHAGGFADSREMTDKLASFVAAKGARGVLVFDGTGEDLTYGPLEVRFAENADSLLERLAAEHRNKEQVCLVSSDSAVRGTSGQEVMKLSSATFSRARAGKPPGAEADADRGQARPGHAGEARRVEKRQGSIMNGTFAEFLYFLDVGAILALAKGTTANALTPVCPWPPPVQPLAPADSRRRSVSSRISSSSSRRATETAPRWITSFGGTPASSG